MSRRSIIALVCLAICLCLALVPWTLPSGRVDRQVRREIAAAFGLDATLTGRATFALLPMPRIKIGAVTLVNAAGAQVLSGAQLRGELRLSALAVGRIELSEISLADGHLAIAIAPDGTTSWDATLERVSSRLREPGGTIAQPRRLLLTGTTILLADRRIGSTVRLDAGNLLLRFPTERSGLDVVAAASWNDQPFEVTVSNVDTALVAAGKPSRFDARLKSRSVNASLSGDLTWTDRPRVIGEVGIDVPSLRDALAWAGYTVGGTDRPFAATSAIAISGEEVALPRLRSTLGAERLDGALSLRLDAGRPDIRATLAGDDLDLSLFPGRGQPTPADGLHALSIRDLTRLDLDLRLSATRADIGGGISLADVAASVLTRPDKVDVTLGRATFGGGLLRGRVTIGSEGNLYDVRGQTSFSSVDMEQCLAMMGGGGLLSGIGQGQAAFETLAAAPDELVRNLSGRVSLTINDGEISGLALADGLRRTEPQAAPAWQGPRTPFQKIHLTLNMAEGSAEFTDATLDSTAQHASMSGFVSLADGTVKAKTQSGPPLGSPVKRPSFALDVSGPWTRPVLALDGPALTSGGP